MILRRGTGEVIVHGPITEEFEDVFQRGYNFAYDLAERGEYPLPDLSSHDLYIACSVLGSPDTPIGGDSFGLLLALVLACRFAQQPLRTDWAFTGAIDNDGNVLPVGGIEVKREGAARLGYKGIALPSTQLDFFCTSIDQIPVTTAYEAWAVLTYGQE